MAYLTASRPPGREKSAAHQMDAHLAATHNIRGGQIYTYQGVALLRLGDLSVWFRAGKISWSTGELGADGRPETVAFPLHETAQAAGKIAQRYRELRGHANLHTVRIR